MSIFSGCTDACGWTAAVVAVLSFGSFGVPIKYAGKVEVHPLVMQSYKTLVCFLTCWGVLLLGEELLFSPYGILSGLFWVPGASMGIFGIRNAGLAVAVGTWSSIAVLTSFFFGIIVFEEGVKDFGQTCLAFCLLIAGLIGMSKYSAPRPEKSVSASPGISPAEPPPVRVPVKRSLSGGSIGGSSKGASERSTSLKGGTSTIIPPSGPAPTQPFEMEPLLDDEEFVMGGDRKRLQKDRYILLGGRVSLTRRQMGVLGAVINGAWGGMCL